MGQGGCIACCTSSSRVNHHQCVPTTSGIYAWVLHVHLTSVQYPSDYVDTTINQLSYPADIKPSSGHYSCCAMSLRKAKGGPQDLRKHPVLSLMVSHQLAILMQHFQDVCQWWSLPKERSCTPETRLRCRQLPEAQMVAIQLHSCVFSWSKQELTVLNSRITKVQV